MKKALVIFAKQPVPGYVKTRLAPPLSLLEAAELYRCMLHDTIARVTSLPGITPYLFFAGDDAAEFTLPAAGLISLRQEGADLGQRMERAFSRLFADGYERVAIIGTDSPDLPTDYLAEAFRLLDSAATDAVYGPSADGGYYLVALKRPTPELFSGIAWSTAAVLATSRERAAAAGIDVALLPPWYDIDTIDDLKRPGLLQEGNGAPLTQQFLRSHETYLKDGTNVRTAVQ